MEVADFVTKDTARVLAGFNRSLCLEFTCEADSVINVSAGPDQFTKEYPKYISTFMDKLRKEGVCQVLKLETRQMMDIKTMTLGHQFRLVALCIKQKPE